MKTLNTARTGNDRTRNTDYHIVEQAGRFKVYDGAGRFRLTFATRDAAQAYIDNKHVIDGHVAFQVATAVLVALFLLCWPLVAQAAPRCPNGGTPTPGGGCVYQPTGMTCAWPFKLVKVGNVTICVKWTVQP